MHTVIPQDRWKDAYLWKTLRDHGAAICFASDWPITDVSVLRAVQAQLTRKPFGADCADERLSLMETLAAYTVGGAWAAHLDGRTGRLAPGMAADLVLLDGDIEAVEAQGIGSIGVALTVCGGSHMRA